MKLKLRKKEKLRIVFLIRLTILGLLFQIVWRLNPNFYLLKIFTAYIVSFLTNSKVVIDPSGVFVVKDSFSLLIITDCTAWKEVFVFLSLVFSWPKHKDFRKAGISIFALFFYNILRLSSLVIFNKAFDYFHPFFQLLSVFLKKLIPILEEKEKEKVFTTCEICGFPASTKICGSCRRIIEIKSILKNMQRT